MKNFKISILCTLVLFISLVGVTLAADFTPSEITLRGTSDDVTIDLNWDTANGTAPYGYRIVWSKLPNPVYPPDENDYFDTKRDEAADNYLMDYFLNTGTYYVRVCVIDELDDCASYSNELSYLITVLDEEVIDSMEPETDPAAEITLTDIESHQNQTAIEYLYLNDVISGYSDNTFRPDQTVNRAELLKILVGGKGVSPSIDQYRDCFPDVTNEWFAPYICYAKSSGWVEGYPDGTFLPGKEVNKVEAIKMLSNSQGYTLPDSLSEDVFSDVSADEWFAPYVKTAKDKDLLEEIGSLYHPDNEMTRAGISENIYRAMYIVENGLDAFPIM